MAATNNKLTLSGNDTVITGWLTGSGDNISAHRWWIPSRQSISLTSRKRPWRLVGVEAHPTVAAAKAHERALKRSPRKLARFKKRLLNRAANGRPCQGVG